MSFSSKFKRIVIEYYSIIMGGSVAIGVAASAIPEMLFPGNYRKMTSYKEEDGSERKIDTANQELITKVLDKISLNPIDEAAIDFYISACSDAVHYGSTKLRSGAVVGLPVSIQYDKDIDISKESFSFSGIRLVFDDTSNSPAAKELAEAFAISQRAKAFLIARETFYANSYRLHIDPSLRALFTCGVIISWHHFCDRNPLLRKLKVWGKTLLFGGICILFGTTYLFLRDAHNCWIDWAVDRRTAKLGKSFALGGVEYYDSILKRNKALRVLTYDGKKHFTAFGNNVNQIRQSSLQITTRKKNLEKYLANYDEKKEVVAPVKVETEEKVNNS